MTTLSLPQLHRANASFVMPFLLVGGDLSLDDDEAVAQLEELRSAGVTHVVDVRVEADDSSFVAEHAPEVQYLHLATSNSAAGGDLRSQNEAPSRLQPKEFPLLVTTHLVDTRLEWSD